VTTKSQFFVCAELTVFVFSVSLITVLWGGRGMDGAGKPEEIMLYIFPFATSAKTGSVRSGRSLPSYRDYRQRQCSIRERLRWCYGNLLPCRSDARKAAALCTAGAGWCGCVFREARINRRHHGAHPFAHQGRVYPHLGVQFYLRVAAGAVNLPFCFIKIILAI